MIESLDNHLPIRSRGPFPCSLSPETLAVNDCNYIVYTNIYTRPVEVYKPLWQFSNCVRAGLVVVQSGTIRGSHGVLQTWAVSVKKEK